MYAVTPIVAYRSALGFGDHHAFDYLLVALAVAGLLLLVDERTDWRAVTRTRLVGFSGFSLAIATQVHAWRGGPLLLLPVAAYVVFRVASDVRAGDSPLQANAWTLGALAVAAVLAIVPHVAFGWSGVYRAFAPALLLVGSLVVVGIGELAARREIAASTVLGLEVVGSIVIGGVAWVAIPDVRRASERGIAYFFQTGQTEITETRSLLSPEFGVITTPIFYLGFTFFLAVAALVWVGWRVKREHRPTWLALTAYTGSLFLLALVQLRFAGQFGILAAVFAGLGFVYLVAAVDVTAYPRPFETDAEPPRSSTRERVSQSTALSFPDRQTVSAVVVLFLLVGSLGAVQTANRSGLVVEGSTYDAAKAIDAHSTTADRTWPDSYVFSDWGRNRVYNYYTSGQSRSYQYAQQNYRSFITSREPEQWYAQLSAKPTGYVVVKPPRDGANPRPETIQSRLWTNWGSATAEVPGTSHYRVVYANEERKVYELVSGATLVSAVPPNSSATASTEVSLSERSFTYEREVNSSPGGATAVTVPYPGEYSVGNATITVDSNAVEQGDYVIDNRLRRPGAPTEVARWTFNEQIGEFAIDRVGDSHGQIQGTPRYRSGVSGEALAFDGENDEVEIADERAPKIGNSSFTVSFWIRGDLCEASVRYPGIMTGGGYGIWARNEPGDFGIRIDDTDGDSVRNFGIKTTEFSSWTHVVVTLDRTEDELRLYRNNTLVQTSSTASLDTVASNASLFIGSRGGADYAPVELDSIRMYNDTLNTTDIRRLDR
jgi:dolichyl-diphosphooligosaccharide--protein glycosyltransferase